MNFRLAATALLAALAAAADASATPERAIVVFDVRVPASTPADAPVWISGDLPELGIWNGAGLRLHAAGERRFVGEVLLEAMSAFEFKVTRGSWETVEKDATGGEIANRRATVTDDDPDTVRVTVAAWRDQVEGAGTTRRSTITGTLRRHAVEGLGEVAGREVLVWLPPGYDSTRADGYPVLYFHDGQNVFDVATSFIGVEWGVDESGDRLVRAKQVPPFLAVGIPNAGGHRAFEYTPIEDHGRGGGGAEAYAQFLIQRVKSVVDARYRTAPGPATTGTVGSSLGGVISMYLGLEHPGTFGMVGCVSPAVFWGERDLLRRAAARPGSTRRVWIDIGTREGGMAGWESAVEDARALHAAMVARGLQNGRDVVLVVAEGAEHDERAWAARTPDILRYLLAGTEPAAAR